MSKALTMRNNMMNLEKQGINQNVVNLLRTDVLYQGFLEIHRLELVHRLHQGGMSPILTREFCHHRPAVAVLPYDPELDVVIMIEQFRVGASASDAPWLLEIVAGITDKEHESPAEVAIRETKEEAGLDVLRLELISTYWVSPGASDEQITLYCGQVNAAAAGGVHGSDEEDEDILVHVVPVMEAFSLLQNGKVNNATSIIALQWLQLYHATLREQWLRALP